ncbi:FAD:protein FMN transferase [Luteolibacter marinus]|uniref:FAD:protein FMN transferase n=1 Tax=Luteolibacter marinus TaxID=2776705 RepID=UPI0018674CE9|nr:FAD:protein FMN transferase [Luteolibacter marinus]
MRAVLRHLVALQMIAALWAAPSRFTFERGLMGTRFAITCHGEDEAVAKAAADEAFKLAGEIEAVASDYIADSELLRLSQGTAGRPVALSPRLFDLLEKSIGFAGRTDGRFDPTMGPLTRLWREARRRGELPEPAVLESARSACGWKLLELDEGTRTATLGHDGMRLDLGGIAKGYTADAMFELMRSRGFASTCIAAGGDLRLGDPPPGKRGWSVGVRTLQKDDLSGQLELSNCAVSTSGDLQQRIEIDGVGYSHIIDPSTGLGLTRHLAVTIVAADATTSDALATAACTVDGSMVEALAKQWGAREVMAEGTVRFMSWNLHHGVGEDGKLDLERIASVIRAQAPDVVVLQEVDNRCRRSGNVDQAAELARLTGMHGAFGKAIDHDGGEYGHAILSKGKLGATAVHRLPGDGEPRIAFEATASVAGKPVRVVSVHLDHQDEERRLGQAVALAGMLGDTTGPMIVGGDFNDIPGSETLKKVGSLGAAVDKSGARLTQPARAPKVEIDHVFVRRLKPVAPARVVPDAIASDHRPVVVELMSDP